MERIVIVGTSSSGKTTLGKSLAKQLNIEHRELDSFFWEPNWVETDIETFRKRVDGFTKNEKWITDGNFSRVRDIVWSRATDIIWLDYSFLTILRQFFKRSIFRSFTKQELWNGNKETLWNSILKPNSLLVWILKTYQRNKKRYPELLNSKDYSHVKFHHFKNLEDTTEFLKKIENDKGYANGKEFL